MPSSHTRPKFDEKIENNEKNKGGVSDPPIGVVAPVVDSIGGPFAFKLV